MKKVEGNFSVNKSKKVAIINARFNHFITDRLVEGAVDAYARHGGNADDLDLILVPGAFEIPFALDKALASGKYDAVCCLGAVIRGATPHFDPSIALSDGPNMIELNKLETLIEQIDAIRSIVE